MGINRGRRRSRARLVQPFREFREPLSIATELACPEVQRVDVHPDFAVDGCSELAHVGADLEILDKLLRAERQQDAKDHHAHFAEEGAPSVQRLGQVNLHSAGPERLRERNICLSARNASQDRPV